MSEPSPRLPRRDDTSADLKSLVALGREEPPPTPGSAEPAPAPAPVDEQEAAALTDALTEAGVTATAEDEAAVQALAGLDAATVATVTRWLQTKKPATPSR